jgi:hypothetical protein
MIYVKDNSPYENELDDSDAHLTLSDGKRSISRTLPVLNDDTPDGDTFWFVGCLRILKGSFVFSSVDLLDRESPYKSQELYCHNLLQNPGSGQVNPPQFCEGVTLRLRLQYGEENLFQYETVDNVNIRVWSTEGGMQQVAETSGKGEFDINILRGGKYIVQASGEGLVSIDETFDVTCDLANCDECAPIAVISMAKKISPSQSLVTLSWSGLPANLDLYIWDNSKRLLSSTSNSIVVEGEATGLVFVDNLRFIPGAKVHVGLKSSNTESYIIDLNNVEERYQKYWIAGCFCQKNNILRFLEWNKFLQTPPQQFYPDADMCSFMEVFCK